LLSRTRSAPTNPFTTAGFARFVERAAAAADLEIKAQSRITDCRRRALQIARAG
jgi:hypothetical protein